MDPRLLAVMEHELADDRTLNEVYGFFARLAGLSAQHTTDYLVGYGTAWQVGGTRENTDRLIALCVFTGLLVDADARDGHRVYKLLDDPEFWHLKTAEELAWEKQRKEDNGNPHITVLVRLRDGDACRYCAKVVRFLGIRKGKLAGTYDHRPPGQPGSAETSVVSCGSCNAQRGNEPVPLADARLPLLEPPVVPYYHRSTREWLNGHHEILAQYHLTPPPLVDDQLDVKPGTPAPGADPAPCGVRPATATRPGGVPTPRRAKPAPPDPARPRRPADPGQIPVRSGSGPVRFPQVTGVLDLDVPGRVGSGRDGSVSGRGAPARSAAPPPPARRRRGRRGGHSTTAARGDT
jgi:hypothetical protein